MTPGDILFLDTNIILAATVTSRKSHEEARAVFSEATGRGIRLATSGQILREYLVVATRPLDENGLGLDLSEAIHNIEQFLQLLVLYPENEVVTEILLSLLSSVHVTGKRIHDANIVALIRAHGISTLVTLNQADFRQFEWLTVLSPAQALAELPR